MLLDLRSLVEAEQAKALNADAGSFVFTGNEASFVVTVVQEGFWSRRRRKKIKVTPRPEPRTIEPLWAEFGSFTSTEQPAVFLRSYALDGSMGSFESETMDAELRAQRYLPLGGAAFQVSPFGATFQVQRSLEADAGSFSSRGTAIGSSHFYDGGKLTPEEEEMIAILLLDEAA